MNTKTRLILIVALLGISAIVLVVALVQCGGQPVTAPPGETAASATPEATAATTLPDGVTVEPGTPIATPAPTPTPTEGEKAAAAVGAKYTYFPTVAECSRAVEKGEVEGCTALESAQQVTRPEWEQLFPETNFHEIQFVGRHQNGEYDYYRHGEVVAWQDGRHYTADTFDRLLTANDIIITDENRELVAKAFALMTIPDYLGEEVVFTEWEEVDMQSARHNYNYCLGVWTRIQGLEIRWCFVFENERMRIASRAGVQQYRVGDYIDVPYEQLFPPAFVDYQFRGE